MFELFENVKLQRRHGTRRSIVGPTPHPGPLPVEGRGRSLLNGERAGVRGENGQKPSEWQPLSLCPSRGSIRPSSLRLLQCIVTTLALFLLLPWAALAAPATLTAHLDRESAGVGETVTLTLTFEGVSPSAPPNLPQLPNIQASYS